MGQPPEIPYSLLLATTCALSAHGCKACLTGKATPEVCFWMMTARLMEPMRVWLIPFGATRT
jgi:hypothetical protein